MTMSARIIVVLFGVLVLTCVVHADGIKIPLQGTIDLPSLSSQQAIITFHEGQETIVVTDRYETESPQVAWILPVPAEPTSLAVANASELDILQANLQPNIRGDEASAIPIALIFLGIILSVVAAWRFGGKYRQNLLCCILAVLLLIGILVPALSLAGFNASMGSSGGVFVVSGGRVGNYEVTVLSAANAEDLDAWLTQNGFETLGDSGESIAQDYIDAGWVFVTAKLVAQPDGELSAHPLAVTFPTDAPVYPMRLTALAGETLTLDLYVIADGAAECEPLEAVVAEQFDTSEWQDALGYTWPRATGRTERRWRFNFRGEIEIFMPSLAERFWDECTVTRLTGRVSPEQMADDLPITIGEPDVFRRTYVSSKIRISRTVSEGILWLAVWVVVAQCMLGKRLQPRFKGAGWITLLAFVCVLVLSGMMYRRCRVLPVPTTTPDIHELISQSYGEELYFDDARIHFTVALADELVSARATDLHTLVGDMDAIATDQGFDNIYTGEPIQYGPAPGDWVLIHGTYSSGYAAAFYDRFGRPHEFSLRPDRARRFIDDDSSLPAEP
jgi:hypothetical protein